MKSYSFDQVNAIEAVENGCMISKNGDITFGFRWLLPELYVTGNEELKENIKSLESIFTRLSNGCVLHQQNVFFIDRQNLKARNHSYTEKCNTRFFHDKPLLRHYCNLFISYPINQRSLLHPSGTIFSKGRSLFSNPYHGYEKVLQTAKKEIKSLINSMNGLKGHKLSPLSSDLLLHELWYYYNLDYDKIPPKVLTTPHVVNFNDDFMLGNKHVGVVSLMEEPKEIASSTLAKTLSKTSFTYGVDYTENVPLHTSMAMPVTFGLPIPHIYNAFFTVSDTDKILDDLDKKAGRIQMLGINSTQDDVDTKSAFIKKFTSEIRAKKLKLLKSGINLITWETSKDRFDNNINAIKDGLAKMDGAVGYEENIDAANLFFSSTPGNFSENYRRMINSSEQALCYWQLESNYNSATDGYQVETRQGERICLDMWEGMDARNMLVFAKTGGGKSFFVCDYVDQCYHSKAPYHIVIIDIGGSFKKVVQDLGGKYFETTHKAEISMNPFLVNQVNGHYLPEKDDIDLIKTIFISLAWATDDIGTEKHVLLKAIIKRYFEFVKTKGEKKPGMTSFYDYFLNEENQILDANQKKFVEYDRLKEIFYEYAHGDSKALLNAEENIDILNDRLICFDIEKVIDDPVTFKVMVVNLIQLVLQKQNKLNGERLVVVLDEWWRILKDPILFAFSNFCWKTIRKKEGQMIGITQQGSDIPANEDGQSIIQNSDIKIFLDHSNNKQAIPYYREHFGMVPNAIQMLESINNEGKPYKELMIGRGGKYAVYRVHVSPETAMMYNSKKSENIALRKYIETYKNVQYAINAYIEEKNETAI